MMGYEFLDMDEVIESEQGIPIPQIFSTRGEAAFRELESELVGRVAELKKYVVATGGGTIVKPENLATLKSCGILVTLTADIEAILARVGSGEGRPMLKDPNVRERIQNLLAQRAGSYAQTDITFDTSSMGIDEVARRLMAEIAAHQ